MPKGFIREEIFSIKIDPKRWLILETKGHRDWSLRVVGPEPLQAYRVELTVREAKDWAVSLAKVFKRGTFEPRSHRDRRRGRRNEIDQQQRGCANCKHGRS